MSHILKFLGQASHQNSSLFISISDNPPTTTGLSGHVYLPYLWSGGNGMNSTPKGVTFPTEAAVIFLYATWSPFFLKCHLWKLKAYSLPARQFSSSQQEVPFSWIFSTKSSSCWDIFKRRRHLRLKFDITEVKLLSDKRLIDLFSYPLGTLTRYTFCGTSLILIKIP